MNQSSTSSFGSYESARILVPGFYFSSLCTLLFHASFSSYITNSISNLFLFIMLVSGLTMYAKEIPKRRRAFIINQPSAFLQDIARRHSASQPLSETEAKQLYFYILNHFIPSGFHDKVLFFGTVYHIMIHIRRTSFWFAILSLLFISIQIARGIALMEQQGLIIFCILVGLIYLLNVKYNKADRKMQENYQDQIFWLQMNEDLLKDLFRKYDLSKKVNAT
jgi:hypothetical protein